MRALAANIEDVFREAAARWTLLAYFFLSTLFIIIFASAVNLDVVNGALAGAKLFGNDVHMNGNTVPIDKLVTGFESVFAPMLYTLCTFLAVFATAHLVPRMQDKGTIDLYLSRPVSRIKLLLSRYVAGLVLATSNVAYLMGAIGVIVLWKTHVLHPRFFLAGALIVFAIAALLAFAFLVGVITSSTGVSIMTTYALFLFSAPLYMHSRFEAAVSSDWAAWLIKAIYWILPKTTEIGMAVLAFVLGQQAPEAAANAMRPATFISTGAFLVGCLALAVWRFQRKEF